MVKNEVFVSYLQELYPDAQCELKYNSTFELLVAVILSAQCTDKRVNEVTSKLFKECNTPEGFAQMQIEELEQKIKSCGFYHNKAKHIKEASIAILEKHNGEVPSNYNALLNLSGVGRKTANVVNATAFKANCIAVDTHVLRVSNRLGFTKSTNPTICERDLVKRFKQNLAILHHRMVLFGRYYCKAIKPECESCKLKAECKYYTNKNK
ncbi:MAG: endonuclease III [Clostridiales bacterium]|nr:endonuclease III [Clostridiales bacterium]